MILQSALQASAVQSDGGLGEKIRPLRIDFGAVGRCPRVPSLTIFDFDDSGSVTAPGGSDPVGNRYEEVRLALEPLRRCRCGRCLAAVVHFDSPAGEVRPGPLRSRQFQDSLAAGLGHPPDAAGTSFMGASLDAAERIAMANPGHTTQLVVLSDWEVFDSEDYITRLQSFPGSVLAVGLGSAPPARLESDLVSVVRIRYEDEPGTLARAMFGALTRFRM